jgi:GAF domain-containing protein
VSTLDDETPIELDVVLEAPSGASPTTISSAPLFGDDESLALNAAKLALSEAFLSLLPLDQTFSDFMREMLLAIMKVIKSEAGSILEVDQPKNSLFFRAVVGTSSDQVSSFVIPMGQGIVGHVAESRRPLLVDNVAENKLHLKAIQDAVGFETRNLVAVPLIVRGKIYGVLELLNRIGEANFLPSDVELLNYTCTMAAKAIEVRLMLAWAAQQQSQFKKVDAA